MNKDAYKIISRHLAENMHVAVAFEPGACPSTDGKNITLPSELAEQNILPMLGALLHETAHIKHSKNPRETANAYDLNQEEMTCLNTLEDIRVDACTDLKYPHAKSFRIKLMEHAIGFRGKEKFSQEETWVKIIKHIIFKAHNFDDSNIYDKKLLDQAQGFEHYIKTAQESKSTEDLIIPARKLYQELALANKNHDPEMQNQLEELSELSKKLMGQAKEKRDQVDNLSEKQMQDYDKYKSQRTGRRRLETNLRKLNSDLNYGQHSKKEKQELSEKIQKQNQKIIDKQTAEQQAIKDYEKTRKDFSETFEQSRALEKESQNALEKIQSKIAGCFTQGKPDIELMGFNAFEGQDFKINSIPVQNINRLEELISESLIYKKNRAIEEESGAKLNSSRLADYLDEDANLFVDSQEHDYNTHVALIVDHSASMQTDVEENSRYSVAINTACALAEGIKKAWENGAPVDFSIYSFGDNIVEVCNSAQDYQTTRTQERYFRSKTGGSTNLARAVNKINELMKEKTTQENVAIIISDADIDAREINRLVNFTNADNTKFIFVGVDANEHNKESFELFGFNNIKVEKEADEIIQRALLSAI